MSNSPTKTGSSFLTIYFKMLLSGQGQDISKWLDKTHGEMMYEIWHENNIGPELQLVPRDLGYPSLTFVRNPLERLISAWREKLGPLADGDLLDNKVKYFVSFFHFHQWIGFNKQIFIK